MTLKTGKKCKWEEIEVGEVFACSGCWEIWEKCSVDTALYLEGDDRRYDEYIDILGSTVSISVKYTAYKLPQSVQRLWKEE